MFQKRCPPGRLLASAITVALAAPAAVANTISVNGTTCTLANAIMSANTDSAVGGCTAGASGHDSIVLTAADAQSTSFGCAPSAIRTLSSCRRWFTLYDSTL